MVCSNLWLSAKEDKDAGSLVSILSFDTCLLFANNVNVLLYDNPIVFYLVFGSSSRPAYKYHHHRDDDGRIKS